MRVEPILRRHPLTSYFVLVYVLTWGGVLLVAGALAASGEAPSPDRVAVVALPMLLAPGATAVAMTAVLEGQAGLRALWARLARWRVGGRWYALALAAMPLLLLVILYTLTALVSPAYAPTLALLGLAGLLAGYLEEIGWTGFATPRLLARGSPLAAGLILGVLWGLWHGAADYMIRGAMLGAFWPVTFALFVLPLVAWRMLMTWAYARTGSGLIAQLMHFSYTGSLALFVPLADLSPEQDALIYAVLAVALYVGVAALALHRRRVAAG